MLSGFYFSYFSAFIILHFGKLYNIIYIYTESIDTTHRISTPAVSNTWATVCLSFPELEWPEPILTASTHQGMARLSWWLQRSQRWPDSTQSNLLPSSLSQAPASAAAVQSYALDISPQARWSAAALVPWPSPQAPTRQLLPAATRINQIADSNCSRMPSGNKTKSATDWAKWRKALPVLPRSVWTVKNRYCRFTCFCHCAPYKCIILRPININIYSLECRQPRANAKKITQRGFPLSTKLWCNRIALKLCNVIDNR